MKKKLFILASILSSFSIAEVGSGTGLQISAAGDILGQFGTNNENKLQAREAEVLLFAPIDQTFDGALNLAAHQEGGEFHFELHELYVGSSKLIPRSRFRLGQFFLGLGRLNQFHRHDWPFTSAPKVQSTFLAEEGLNDSGIEYGYLFPTPFYLDLTLGVTNGWVFGEGTKPGNRPNFPTHYARLATYNSLNGLFSGGGMQTGLNYLGRTDYQDTKTHLIGLDLTAKLKEATVLKYLFQAEFWYRIQTPRDAASEKAYGFYLYPQYGISQNWQIGMRLDGFSVTTLKDTTTGADLPNFDYALVPTLTYKASEFSTIRASYNFKGTRSEGKSINEEQILELQAVFILGAHPAHDF